MSLWDRITSKFAPGAAKNVPKKTAVPAVPRGSRLIKAGGRRRSVTDARGMLSGLMWISALFPFAVYKVMGRSVQDRALFCQIQTDTLSLGNSGMKSKLTRDPNSRRKRSCSCHDFAARCYPIAAVRTACSTACSADLPCRWIVHGVSPCFGFFGSETGLSRAAPHMQMAHRA